MTCCGGDLAYEAEDAWPRRPLPLSMPKGRVRGSGCCGIGLVRAEPADAVSLLRPHAVGMLALEVRRYSRAEARLATLRCLLPSNTRLGRARHG